MAEPATELTLDSASLLAAEEHEVAIRGRSPWYLAWRRLRRNYFALFSLGVFIVIVVSCALAPVYAHHVAHTGPNDTHPSDTVIVSGHATKACMASCTVVENRNARNQTRPRASCVSISPYFGRYGASL